MPTIPGDTDLTGAIRHRTGWFGKQILQVEERYLSHYTGPTYKRLPVLRSERQPVYKTRWRDATIHDYYFLKSISIIDKPV